MGGRGCGTVLLLLFSVLLLWQSCEAAGRGMNKLGKKNHDEAHSSRKYKQIAGGHDKKTGSNRSGHGHDHAANGKGGKGGKKGNRRLQQATGVTTITPGMSVCVAAADAASYITSSAGFLSVSNAQWTAGACNTATYAGPATGTGGLSWGIVQTWPADHTLAAVFPNKGALVLGSGDVTESQRVVNDLDDFTADNQLAGDADLDALIPGYTTHDATVLEFDVTPSRSGALVFEYVFASEEYNEWVDSPFNDVFGFFISPADKSSAPVNVAYLPDLVTPVSINNVNYHANSQYYKDNDLEPRPTIFPPPSPFNTSYDGFTTLLNTRSYDVVAGTAYHFKLAVADAGDHILDSAVWIAGGSLLVNNPPKVVTDGPYILPCPGSINLHATGTDDDGDALKYQWNLTSTTLPGVHIAKLTQDAMLALPDDAIPADVYELHVTAIDTHGSLAISASTLTVLACPAPEGNHAPQPGFVGAPYTLEVCNGVGSLTMDAGSSAESDPADSIKQVVWEISGADLELKLTGTTVTVTAAQGFYAGNKYEVEVFVQDSYGVSSAAETTLTVVPTPGCNGGGGGTCTGANCFNGQYTEAIISSGPYELACGSVVTLDGSLSTSFDGAALGYHWDFYNPDTGAVYTVPESASTGGEISIATPNVDISAATASWLEPGVTYWITLNVVDSSTAWASDTTNFTVAPCAPNQPPTAVLAGASVTLKCGGSVTLDGTGSTDPEGAIAGYTFNILDATGAVVATKSSTTGLAVISQVEDGLAVATTYTADLTVTDAAGDSASTSQDLKVTSCNQPPVAVLSGGTKLSLKCGGTTTIDGTASSDPDGNDDIAGYTFEILDAANKVIATKNSTNGKASISQATDNIPSSASYTIKLTVSDKAGATGTATQGLSVSNCAPVAVLSPSLATVACGGSVTLSGASSTDVDGTVNTYAWKLVYNTQTISKPVTTIPTLTLSQLTDKLATGAAYSVTLTVTDNSGNSATATGSLTVASGCVAPPPPPPPPSPSPSPPPSGPVCSNAVANVTTINVGTTTGTTAFHTMVGVAVQGVIGNTVTITITSVTQNEAGSAKDTKMSGTWTCTDAVLKNSNANAQVSAELLNYGSATATGRLYVISYTAKDKNTLTCSGTVTVCVKSSSMASCNVTPTAATAYNSLTKAC